MLSNARPTAVNLGFAVRQVYRAYQKGGVEQAVRQAEQIFDVDVVCCTRIAEYGLFL